MRPLFLIALLLLSPAPVRAGDTLSDVRTAKALACAVNNNEADYSKFQTHGNLSALGLDICKAVAAAVGVPAAPVLVHDDPSGLQAVRSGKVALLAGGTPDLAYQSAFHVAFGPPVFMDGQGFLVHRESGIAAVADLANKQVCFLTETNAEKDLADRMALRRVAYIPFPFEETGEMEAALVTGHCGAIAAPVSELADMRTGFHARTSHYQILPDTVTQEPVVPVYRDNDPRWAAIVDWTVHALVLAEEAGITRENEADRAKNGTPEARYLLGGDAGVGRALGLDDNWARRAIEAVGNYGEVFDRDLGAGSPLRLPRGRNALWTDGGMIFAPPLR